MVTHKSCEPRSRTNGNSQTKKLEFGLGLFDFSGVGCRMMRIKVTV